MWNSALSTNDHLTLRLTFTHTLYLLQQPNKSHDRIFKGPKIKQLVD